MLKSAVEHTGSTAKADHRGRRGRSPSGAVRHAGHLSLGLWRHSNCSPLGSAACLPADAVRAERGRAGRSDGSRFCTARSASDGRDIRGLLDFTRTSSVTAQAFDLIVTTQLQDVARQASSIALGSRPAVDGYVRMLNPPSCSRCAVLAGKFYRRNRGFARHPKCDCRHVPATEVSAGDLRTDPNRYFESLDAAAGRHLHQGGRRRDPTWSRRCAGRERPCWHVTA